MARAPALQAGGREFEPRRIHKKIQENDVSDYHHRSLFAYCVHRVQEVHG